MLTRRSSFFLMIALMACGFTLMLTALAISMPRASTTTPNATDTSDATSTPALKVGGDVLPPKVIYNVPPEFSQEARKKKISGVVVIGLEVDEEGNPVGVHVIRGVGHGLDEKAMEAVSQYRFKPATRNGTPVRVQLKIEVNFQIFTKRGDPVPPAPSANQP